jgi:hypothetical protein
VQMLLFFIFAVGLVASVVGLIALELGYGLSSFEERSISRRCLMPYQIHRRRKVRRQRLKCRFEG